MKTIFSFIFAATAAIIISGCATPTAQVTFSSDKQKNQIVIKKEKTTDVYSFQHPLSIYAEYNEERYKQGLAETLYTAAQFGQKKGYKYFGLVNIGANNFSGFPLNSYDSLIQWGMLHENMKKREHFKPLLKTSQDTIISNMKVDLRVVYSKEAIPGLFLFNIEQTMKDTAAAI